MRYPIEPPDISPRYRLGDSTLAARGDLVDWTKGSAQTPADGRRRGEIIVIDEGFAWVQFPESPEPGKYSLHELGAASPEPLPDFRTFFAETRRSRRPGKIGETYDHSFERLADALADYADEIRKRSGC